MRFVGERVDAGGVDPTVIKIEQRADSDRVVDRFVLPPYGAKGCQIVGGDLRRLMVYAVDEAEERFFLVAEIGVIEIADRLSDEGFAVGSDFFLFEEHRRDRGVRLESNQKEKSLRAEV